MTALLDAVMVTGVALMDTLLVASFVAMVIYFWRQWQRQRSSAAAAAMVSPAPRRAPHASEQVALDILNERYQRGEIDAAELEGRRALLRRER